jgi:hypothetical protein
VGGWVGMGWALHKADRQQNIKLDPWFVTGFCDAEASFSVSIYMDKRIKGRQGWVVKPSFQISLNSRDINLLLQLKEFFACAAQRKHCKKK